MCLRYRPSLAVMIPLFAQLTLSGSTSQPSSVSQLARRSNHIILGRVLTNHSFLEADDNIYTDVTIRIEHTIKGLNVDTIRTFRVLGGMVGDNLQVVGDAPRLTVGDRLALFLDQHQDILAAHSFSDKDITETGQAARTFLEEVFQGLDSRVAESEIRSKLEAFLDTGIPTPARAANVATAASNSCYAPLGVKWGRPSTTFRIDSTIPTEWIKPISDAVSAWNHAGSLFRYSVDPNSVNVITLGSLGLLNSDAAGLTSRNSTAGILTRATITLNSQLPLGILGDANSYDVQSIVTHELGHMLGLDHPSSDQTCSEVTMWSILIKGETKKRTLELPDRNGVVSLYGAETGTIVVDATLNGATWRGKVNCRMASEETGDTPITTVNASFSRIRTGLYAVGCDATGNPGTLMDIKPVWVQQLNVGSTLSYTLKFVSKPVPGSLMATCSVLPVNPGQNQSLTFTTMPSGGVVGGYTASWFEVTGQDLSLSGLSQSFTPLTTGLYTKRVVVRDVSGAQVTITCTASVVPTVTVYANPLPSQPSGVYWTWSVTAAQTSTSGTWITQPILTYAGVNYVFNHPQGYVEAFKELKAFGATGPLDQLISVYQSWLQYWPPFVVISAPSQPGGPPLLGGSCTVNNSSIPQSFQNSTLITWNANVSGGTGSYNFVWSGIEGGNRPALGFLGIAAGTYNVSVVVTDTGSPQQKTTLACPQVTVTAVSSLGCGCSLSPNPIIFGSGSTLSASCVGGTGSYTFLLPNSNGYSSTYSSLVQPTIRGTQTYTITGKDSTGSTASGSCSLSVN